MSDFPNIIHPTTNYTDDVDVIQSEHVNSAHDELEAITTILNKMQDIIEGYTYDRDYIEGLDVRFKTTSSVDITAGFICISGTVYRAPETFSISTADNMRDGESVIDNALYYAYCFFEDDELKAEFSTTDPGADLLHPDDSTRKVCGFIRRASGAFLAYLAYGDVVLVPTPVLWGGSVMANPASLDLSEHVPPSVKEIKMAGYMTSNSGRTGRWYLSPDSTLYWPLTTLVMLFYQTNDVHNFDVFLTLTQRSFNYQLQAGNYGGLYLSEIRWNRKRY